MIGTFFRMPRPVKRLLQVSADILIIAISLVGAMALHGAQPVLPFSQAFWATLAFLVAVSLPMFVWLGFYRAIIRYMSLKAAWVMLLGVVSSSIALFIISRLVGLSISWAVPIIYGLICGFLVGGIRFAFRALFVQSQVRLKSPVIIYGAGEAGRQLAASLRQGRDHVAAAFVDDASSLQGSLIEGIMVHPPEALASLVSGLSAELILLAIPSASRAQRQTILDRLEPLPVPVKTIPSVGDLVSGKSRVSEIRHVAVEDLLGRDPIPADPDLMDANIRGRNVLVSGAGGSIGQELCRQILHRAPRELILLELSEYALYLAEQELGAMAKSLGIPCLIRPILGSVQNPHRIESILRIFRVQTVYHAAAYKHVPLVEQNVVEGLRNNVFGTLTIARAAIDAGVEAFILVSTDKAVRPTNIMGASKRMAELVCQALARTQKTTSFSMVRFGNVLGSSGSVIPLFRRQIEQGGPVTVTHPEVTRYFMTIPEAAQLVIQAGAMAKGGDVFVLDMGQPVQIVDLARRMIRLSGFRPFIKGVNREEEGDMEIIFTGLRTGEKPFEELLIGDSPQATRHPRIMTASETFMPWEELQPLLDKLFEACRRYDVPMIRNLLVSAPTGYKPEQVIVDQTWDPQNLAQTDEAGNLIPITRARAIRKGDTQGQGPRAAS
ncbi:polysaccharide biosynthesis protein [Sandaracinobacteroides sp. A072]|uniref:polysaccharide biosynthesis protein n=1 Tax=Sandaracinobacteroides sp. A072 TaxID=3461146 RepID=UPI0040412181